jgi:hypothetical protein
MMKAVSSCEMSVNIYQTAQCNNFVVSVVELLLLCNDVNHGINPLNPKIIFIIYKDSVPAAKKMQPTVPLQRYYWLTFFKEIIPVYSENHTKPINTICGQNAEL